MNKFHERIGIINKKKVRNNLKKLSKTFSSVFILLKTKKIRGNTKVKLDNARNPNIKLNRYILLKSSISQTRK